MADRRRRFWGWLLPRLLIFAVGVAVGYYARDRETRRVSEAYEQAVVELERLKATGQDMIDRGRRAGESLKAGAETVADSTKAAVESIKGESKN
jgi:hypothetical protein